MKRFSFLIYLPVALFLLFTQSCQKKTPSAFELLDGETTGIDFSNDLNPTKDFNIFRYMYFYNGGGIGAGDLNNDGWVDLVFTANMTDNKVFLNKGNMKFENVTEKANFKGGKGWSNGVSIVDINQDGLLDIYVSQVGDFEVLKGHNLLFVCQKIGADGVPVYEEQSQKYGLDLIGFGTQAAFFDYDLDGDLDMFQLNHSVHQNGTFGSRDNFKGTIHPLAGDRFYVNNNGKFEEITQQAGIAADALGYGLGIGLGDFNFDGYPDMYIGNDFHENDYLYINQKNGSFADQLTSQIGHTSQFSMGVDVADLNNDFWDDIVSMDMLPYDREILKRSEGEDSYSTFFYKIQAGYGYQFSRNNLQLNRGDNTFSEIGLYANMFATDWSWSPLIFDFDNDGRKDLFVSNGIPKRVNDMDYINFISSEEVQNKLDQKQMDEKDISLDGKLPEIKIPNQFFKNKPDLAFEEIASQIANNQNSYSNGAIYADLDNDGDLDIVTNNINEKAYVYKNLADAYAPEQGHTRLYLKGKAQNLNAIGAKVLIFKKNETLYFEKFPVRAFQASMEIPMVMGLGNRAEVDSAYLIWPDRTFQKIRKEDLKDSLTISYKANLPVFDFEGFKNKYRPKTYFKDVSEMLGVTVKHEENLFHEFEREALIPHKMSSEGPALAVADINHDGLEDFFIGSSQTSLAKVYLQQSNGKFKEIAQPDLQKDLNYEEVDAQWVDINGDSHLDLLVAEGGNQYAVGSEYIQPRLYLNDGKGLLKAQEGAFPAVTMTEACIKAQDINGDGRPEVFVGGRSVPFAYGKIPHSYLFKYNGKQFVDITAKTAPELSEVGLVKNAESVDLDKDGDTDLLLSLEWDGLCLFENQKGKLVKKMLTQERGWWNFTYTTDIDADGDLDIVAGNLGLNSRLKASPEQPVRLYVNDFDKNGSTDGLLTYYLGGQEILFANKTETQKQFPFMKKKFLLAKDFAKAEIKDLVGSTELEAAKTLEANYFSNAVLLNDGKGNFSIKALPYQAQLAPYFAAQAINANSDNLPDFLLMGNFYDCNVQMGRYDADYGTLLVNKGKGDFEVKPLGISIKGQVKRLKPIKIQGKTYILVVRNNDTLMVLSQI